MLRQAAERTHRRKEACLRKQLRQEQKHSHLLSTYCLLGPGLSPFHIFPHVTLTTPPWERQHYYHFISGGTKA